MNNRENPAKDAQQLKAQLRAQMRARRAALPTQRQREDAGKLAERIVAFAPYRAAGTVMAYIAARGEISLAPVIDDILARGRRLALPRCEAPGVMTARLVRSPADLAPGMYGLMEPNASCSVIAPQEIDLILLPGTAYDREGGRIGQGGGYYDRFLPETNALRAGVCHDFALIDSLPMQAYDQRMDAVITPGGLILLTNNEHGRMPQDAAKQQEETP